jgi:hypothetical protein
MRPPAARGRVRIAQAGIAAAAAAGQTVVADRFRQRLTLYQQRQPLRMPH